MSFLVGMVLSVLLLTASAAGAATYRIQVTVEKAVLSLDTVYISKEDDYTVMERNREVTAAELGDSLFDGVENENESRDVSSGLDALRSKQKRGTLVLRETSSSGFFFYAPLACTGIFASQFCREYRSYPFGISRGPLRLIDSFESANFLEFTITQDRIVYDTDGGSNWTNDLGTVNVEGSQFRYELSDLSIRPVPLPAPAAMLAMGVAALGAVSASRRRRRSS